MDRTEERGETIYVGVFTCKGGDLHRQQNMRKLLGKGVYFPRTKGESSAKISVLSHEEWNESVYKDMKIVVCDSNPEFDANPAKLSENSITVLSRQL